MKWKRKNVAIPFSSGLLSFSDRQVKLYISMVAIPFSSGLLSFDIGRLVSWRLRVAIPFSSGLLSFQFWEGTFKEFVSRNPFFIRSSFLSAIASYCKEISGSQSLFHQVFFPLDAAERDWWDVWSQSLFHQVFFPLTESLSIKSLSMSQSLFHQVFFPFIHRIWIEKGGEVAIPFSSGLLSFDC